MKIRHIAGGAVLALVLIEGAAAGPIPMDTPVSMGGIETVCTGIGDGKNDPRWKTFPVRVEFANASAQYVAGAHVTLSDVAGTTLADFDCSGSWVLFRMARGLYTVSGRLPAANLAPASAKFQPPVTGQMRVVLRFTSPP
jgi:hypothetical protein